MDRSKVRRGGRAVSLWVQWLEFRAVFLAKGMVLKHSLSRIQG